MVRYNMFLNSYSIIIQNIKMVLFYFILFLFVVDFVINWNETAVGLHGFPIFIFLVKIYFLVLTPEDLD